MRTEEHWAAYNDDQGDRQPRPLCRELVAMAGPGGGRQALDLGCGAGLETLALLRAGWRVHAIDSAPGTRERVTRAVGDHDAGLTVDTVDLATLRDHPPVDLVYAGYSLPYLAPDDFHQVWAVLRAILRPGAWLAVNLFGDHDSWAATPGETFLTATEARALFDGLHIIRFTEEDAAGDSYSGPKHWHVFDVIARSPAGGR